MWRRGAGRRLGLTNLAGKDASDEEQPDQCNEAWSGPFAAGPMVSLIGLAMTASSFDLVVVSLGGPTRVRRTVVSVVPIVSVRSSSPRISLTRASSSGSPNLYGWFFPKL